MKQVCSGTNHNYHALPGDRYAKDGNGSWTDTRVWYHVIFCSQCGQTVEVVAEDRRSEAKEEAKESFKITSPFTHQIHPNDS